MNGFVVVLEEDSSGVVSFPNVPDAAGLDRLMRSQMAGQRVVPTSKYLEGAGGTVIAFTHDRKRAHVFTTEGEAQAAIDRIPTMVRPAGLSVQPAG